MELPFKWQVVESRRHQLTPSGTFLWFPVSRWLFKLWSLWSDVLWRCFPLFFYLFVFYLFFGLIPLWDNLSLLKVILTSLFLFFRSWADAASSDQCRVSYFAFEDPLIGNRSDPNETLTVISASVEEDLLERSTGLLQNTDGDNRPLAE